MMKTSTSSRNRVSRNHVSRNARPGATSVLAASVSLATVLPAAAQISTSPAAALPPASPRGDGVESRSLTSLSAVNVLIVPLDDVDLVAAVPATPSSHFASHLARLMQQESARSKSARSKSARSESVPSNHAVFSLLSASLRPASFATAGMSTAGMSTHVAAPSTSSLSLAADAGSMRLAQIDEGAASGSGFDALQGFQGGLPGASQQAAGPLRQALLRQGLSDVLSAAPDSAVMRRALNEKRVAPEVLGALRNAMTQLVALSDATGVAMEGVAKATGGAAIVVEPRAGMPVALPESAQERKERLTMAATQSATQAAVQLGQALNYRAVVVLAVVPARDGSGSTGRGGGKATYSLLSVDAMRESAAFSSFESNGATVLARNQQAAQTASQSLARRLLELRPMTARERSQRVDEYLKTARAALERGAWEEARANAKQAIALEPARSESHVVLGDALKTSDPVAAAAAYRQALDGSGRESGAVWAKMAASYAAAKDWPNTLKAGQRALAARFDSASLRAAMATAQFGRALLFRNAGREESAATAEADGRDHLNRAREMAPDDPDIARLLVGQMVAQGQYKAALQLLDALAPKYPNDVELQTVYATALTERGGRNADAFAAWTRVWKAKGVLSVPLDARFYSRLAQGFDEYVADLAKQALVEVNGVAQGTMPREAALLKVMRWSAAMDNAKDAISLILPPDTVRDALHAGRVLAADLLSQALEEERVYLETGDDLQRNRATDHHRQAILRLNAARAGNR